MAESIDGVPKKFYKYRSLNGDSAQWAERTILHNEIYFPAASSFNDPFDLRPLFSLDATSEKQREDYLRLSKKFEPHLTEEQRAVEADRVMATSMSVDNVHSTTSTIQFVHSQFLTSKVGVLCFSTKPDDVLMWSHYGGSHKGICFEFEGTSAFMAQVQKVQYSPERVPINPYVDSYDAMMSKALLLKSEQWSYEAEWRLCRYNDGPGVVQFEPASLSGIIIGALAPPSTVGMVKRWAGGRAIPIHLYRATISSKKFAVDITPHCD